MGLESVEVRRRDGVMCAARVEDVEETDRALMLEREREVNGVLQLTALRLMSWYLNVSKARMEVVSATMYLRKACRGGEGRCRGRGSYAYG